MGRPKGSLNKKGKKPAPKKKTKEETKKEKEMFRQMEIKSLRSKIATDEQFKKLDKDDKRRDLQFRTDLRRMTGEKILRKKDKKPPSIGKSNPTGRAKKTDRKLDKNHSNAIKQGSVNYHKCCREKGKCGKKYNLK